MASLPIDTTPAVDTEATSREVKRYQRQKLIASIASLVVSLAALAIMALVGGPKLDAALRPWTGDNAWLRLIAIAFVYAAGLELLTLPLDFWSGFVLEHRYQLSNQTFLRWAWQRIKG